MVFGKVTGCIFEVLVTTSASCEEHEKSTDVARISSKPSRYSASGESPYIVDSMSRCPLA